MRDLSQPQPAGRTLRLTEPRVVLIAWAVLIAVVAITIYSKRPPTTMMQSRVTEVASSIDVLDHGGPPLLVSDVPYRPGISAAHLTAAGTTDDQGIYLYLPLIGHWTGEHDPAVLMNWLFSGCFVLLLVLLPFVVYGVFGSLAAAFVAPLLVLWQFTRGNTDLYWIQAWSVLLGIPVLLLAHRWWTEGRRRRVVATLVPLMVVAGFATSIRSQSGLPILLAGAGLVLLAGASLRGRTGRDWVVRGVVTGALVVSYLSVSLAFVAVRAYRDSRVQLTGTSQLTSHPFWHPAYLGLGYLPNRYGLEWSDQVAIDAVDRVHPGTTYLSGAYESTLRHLYVKLVEHDPVFALRTYATKTWAILDTALRRFWLAPLLLAAALALRRPRRLGVAAWLVLPALVIGVSSPLLAIPITSYELGWLGAVGVAWLLVICWAVARVEAVVRSGARLALITDQIRLRRLRRRPGRGVVAAAVVLAATGALAAAGRPAVPVSSYTKPAAFVDLGALQRPATISWHFAGHLPAGWVAASGSSLQRDYGGTELRGDARLGLHVTTTMQPNADELTGPTISLQPGRYALVGRAQVLAGGLGIVVRDAGTGASLATGDYWYKQGNYFENAVGTSFSIERPTRIRVVLANWSTISDASSWVLWSLELQRLDQTALERFYQAGASPLTAASSLVGTRVATWSFGKRLPHGWKTDGNVEETPDAGRLGIVTTTQRFAYQLVSAPRQLPAGRYAVSVEGRILDGGLELGVLDATRNVWITTRNFYDRQQTADGKTMAATATLTAPTRVQIVLANWAPWARSSQWSLERVRLVRLR